jgi:hypothetical protein
LEKKDLDAVKVVCNSIDTMRSPVLKVVPLFDITKDEWKKLYFIIYKLVLEICKKFPVPLIVTINDEDPGRGDCVSSDGVHTIKDHHSEAFGDQYVCVDCFKVFNKFKKGES